MEGVTGSIPVVPTTSFKLSNWNRTIFNDIPLAQAEDFYRGILNKHPQDANALNDLGRVLQKQGRLDEAIALFRRLVALQPNSAPALWNLGVALCHRGFLEESFTLLRQHAELTCGTATNSKQNAEPSHKIQHDREQRAYLDQHNISASTFHIESGARVAGRAVNPDLSNAAAQWGKTNPRILIIDNFLSNEALNAMRRFCWGSTVWRSSYQDGYLGAFPEHGFGSPLLAQIADELRVTYPSILQQHPLMQFWGFKYDSGLKGIGVHADSAAVNINFWITPDDANLDRARGGLKIWDVLAPSDWAFDKYNDDVAATREFLAQSGAKATIIPYRCNRAVVFDSNLFHETDQIKFKDGYLNRRINITFLYGCRLP